MVKKFQVHFEIQVLTVKLYFNTADNQDKIS